MMSSPIKIHSTIDLARLAAYIDGEGCIYISHQKARGRAVSKLHSLIVSVANSDPKLINWLTSNFGGFVAQTVANPLSTRPCFTWRLANTRAATLLEQCLPYFIIKLDQAQIALAFQNTMTNRGTRVPVEVVEQREKFRLALKVCKKQSFTFSDVTQ